MTCSARIRFAAAIVALSVPVGLSAQNPRPDSHTVRSGDTLWDLARTYLGDPFLWPEIYRLNTAVVEDPHWIYPGEVLRLSGGGDVSAVPRTDTPPPGDSAQAGQMAHDDQPPAAADEAPAGAGLSEPQVADLTDDSSPDSRDSVDLTPLVGDRRRVATGPNLERALQRTYRPVRRTEFYSSGFLSEGQVLPFGTILGVITPLQIEEVSSRSTAQMYGSVAVVPPAGAKYQVGDTLLAVWISEETQNYGTVIVPTGLLRISDVSRPENQAEVIAAFGAVRDHQSVLPAEKFIDPGNVRPVPISDGVNGKVIRHRDDRALTDPQAVIFLDHGRKDGVALGDLFELRQAPRAREDAATVVNEVMAIVQVVHLGERTATTRIVRIFQPKIPPGTEARQIAKLPS